jgi:hypothetical protein
MAVLAPVAFTKILALQPTSRSEAIRVVRALITVEGEVDPSKVGRGATVVVLPISGNGTVMEYETPLSIGKQRRKAN